MPSYSSLLQIENLTFTTISPNSVEVLTYSYNNNFESLFSFNSTNANKFKNASIYAHILVFSIPGNSSLNITFRYVNESKPNYTSKAGDFAK